MKLKALIFTLLTSVLWSASSLAACTAPDEPAIPDGTAASGADMFKAKKDVETYMEAAEAYLDCGVATMQHNRMVEKMEKIAREFNSSLRAYKAKA